MSIVSVVSVVVLLPKVVGWMDVMVRGMIEVVEVAGPGRM